MTHVMSNLPIDLRAKILAGENLSQREAQAVILAIMGGDWPEDDTAEVLLALRAKGETADEIAGAAAALRQLMRPIPTRHSRLIDTCGTGGDGASTFNISTAAALVTAAAGLPVAKHGNRGVSSKSGSADVLRELGVDVEAPLDRVAACLDQLDICFCFAPLWHGSVKKVADVRRRLAVPTIFNWLGPLVNPAGTGFQLLGVGQPAMRLKVAEALGRLGTQRSAVVCGQDGLDEVTITGPTDVCLVTPHAMSHITWTPELFGLPRSDLTECRADGPVGSARLIRAVLAGRPGTARDIVILNAAAALWVAGCHSDHRVCGKMAAEAIDGGAGARLLEKLSELSMAR